MVEYKCDLQLDENCKIHYKYYSGVYENPEYSTCDHLIAKQKKIPYEVVSGDLFEVNSLRFCNLLPLDTFAGDKVEEEPNDQIISRYFNVCPNCMRTLLLRVRKNTGLAL